MTYDQFLDHLFSRGRFGIKPGLERIKALLARLGNPQEKLVCVHIVGTNGKGSTAAFISSILTCAGHRTGLFTSPHLIDFCERFRIDGDEITEADVLRIGRTVLDAAPAGTTFFEIVTAMALVYFADRGTDIVILEAGMGGGSDATACVPGILTIVTPISLDHSEYLGDNVATIACEKASIIADGTRVVSSAQAEEVLAVLADICRERNVDIRVAGSDFRSGRNSRGIFYRSGESRLEGVVSGLAGGFQIENAGTAIAAAEALRDLGFPVSEQAVRDGIAKAQWPGRLERFPGHPEVILDGAHNPAGAAALADALRDLELNLPVAVVGAMSDKDVDGIVDQFDGIFCRYVTAEPSVGRAVPSGELAARLAARGLPAISGGTPSEALATAREVASSGSAIVVFGSLYLVGEVRAHLLGRPYRGIRG